MSIPLRLLLLEDASDNIEALITTLEQAGYKCRWTQVQSADEALARFSKASYDLAVVNYNASAYDPLSALKCLNEQASELPLLVIADETDADTAVACFLAGAGHYILRRRLTDILPALQKILGDRVSPAQTAPPRSPWHEERFQQVIASISDHIYVTEVTAAGTYNNLYISPHIESLTGYPIENFMHDRNFWPSVVIHPEDRSIAAVQSNRLTKGENSETEYRIRRQNGQVIWVRDSARVEAQGESRIIYGLVSNINERKRIEQRIYELNENLEQRVIDRTRELKVLYEITAIASESFSLRRTLERSLERILAAMRSEAGMIHLLSDEVENRLYLAIHQGIPDDLAAQMQHIATGQGFIGKIAREGESITVTDMATDLGLATFDETPFALALSVPIRLRGYRLGVLTLFNRTEYRYSSEEVAMLTSIADQVGVAVENAQLHALAEQAAIMEERSRLARELHDSVTQSLYSLTLLVGSGQRLARMNRLDDAESFLAELGDIAQEALKEMRLLVYELRPPILEEEGLIAALQQRLDAVEGRAGVTTRLLADPQIELPGVIESCLFSIAREALNNVLKHAAATAVTIQLTTTEERVTFTIRDDGQGFEPEIVAKQGGMGLTGIRERVEQLGGQLTIHSAPGQGTQVKVELRLTSGQPAMRML